MAVSRVRCSVCHQYFDRDEAFKILPLSRLCSEDCYGAYLDKRRDRQPKSAPAARARKPSLPIRIRRLVRERDANVCRFCGIRGQEVHHIQYRSSGGSDEPSNLILLCNEHHALVHSNKRRWQPVLFGVLWMGYVEGRWMTVPQFVRYFGRTEKVIA
jgi:hypothetical protein